MAPLKRFCLIGHPVAGSLSPALMYAAYGGRYSYDLVDEELFERAWARGQEYDAFNVTAPYKRLAFGRSTFHDWHSSKTGASNLIFPGDDILSFNTDVEGVAGAVRESDLPMNPARQKSALIVGTGGAAAAAVAACERYLNRDCLVAGRDIAKARELSSYCTGLNPLALEPETVKDIDLVIYTLPGSAPVPEGLPLENAVVLEAEYKTPRLASKACRQYISGKLWLLHQAIAGFRIMTGEEPDILAMRAVLGL
ncbi:MAG: hypothetical protein J5769_07010 [Bacteroidales bacterium]|nr:hypothetical protein [Bacteroidales bacterium]